MPKKLSRKEMGQSSGELDICCVRNCAAWAEICQVMEPHCV